MNATGHAKMMGMATPKPKTAPSVPKMTMLRNAGDGPLVVPDLGSGAVAPGKTFSVEPKVAKRLLADTTIAVEAADEKDNKA